MPTPVTWPTARSFIGVTKEATQGTAVPPLVATCPVMKFSPDDQFEELKDTAQRGDMAKTYGQIQGAGHVEWSIDESPAFYDWLPYFLFNILGDISTTGAGPFTHVMSLQNAGSAQPITLTIFDWQGTPTNQGRQYPGIVVTELTIKGNPESEFITWSAKGLGWLSAVTAAAPVSAPTTDAPMAAWRSQIQIATVADPTLGEWSVTFSREGSAEHTSNNTQQPFIIQRGELAVTGTIRVRKPANETFYANYLNNSAVQVTIVADNGGATTARRNLSINMQSVQFDKGTLARDDLAIGYNMSFEANANTTDAGTSAGRSPAKVTVINNVASGTYS